MPRLCAIMVACALGVAIMAACACVPASAQADTVKLGLLQFYPGGPGGHAYFPDPGPEPKQVAAKPRRVGVGAFS